MTKLEMMQPEVIPDFDVLKWKEEIQAEIYEEIKDMTTEEMIEYFKRSAERFDNEMELRRAELAKKQHEEITK